MKGGVYRMLTPHQTAPVYMPAIYGARLKVAMRKIP